MSTFENIKGIIAKSARIPEEKIVMDAKFKDDLGMDSLELAETIMELEKEFDCEIPEDEAEKIITVADAVAYLDNVKK